MPETDLEYQICLFFLLVFGLVAVLLLPTPDERRSEPRTHDTTKTWWLP
jgi:hypothetical protein